MNPIVNLSEFRMTSTKRTEWLGFREHTYSRKMSLLCKMPHVQLANAFGWLELWLLGCILMKVMFPLITVNIATQKLGLFTVYMASYFLQFLCGLFSVAAVTSTFGVSVKGKGKGLHKLVVQHFSMGFKLTCWVYSYSIRLIKAGFTDLKK